MNKCTNPNCVICYPKDTLGEARLYLDAMNKFNNGDLIWYKSRKDPVITELVKCPVCKQNRKMTRHHLVPKSMGGSNYKKNIFLVCKQCHQDINSHDLTVAIPVRAQIRAQLRPDQIRYIRSIKGEFWFNVNYPVPRIK